MVYLDESGIKMTRTIQPRSASIRHYDEHSGNSYIISDLLPNTVYNIKVSAHYSRGKAIETQWVVTNCQTRMLLLSLGPETDCHGGTHTEFSTDAPSRKTVH
ncbi:unnamed protein product [Protopolystoma xenopodis]|uniref:Fibronectin type-III domain-containing protein n=1 Tax=Protopolystoma xenopodis TaxID=117903 RepID=A0A448WMZ9_9PLAT|nr:unnamed protein product [Protopolystoma xenopodis]